jgi:EAL domain-containing protein (putative c-di-GMP-specific phosphodiesterase class I)/GGDEF domain-containing protein
MNSSSDAPGPGGSTKIVIHSRSTFAKALDAAIQASERDGGRFSVLEVGLDNLTLIQEALGEPAAAIVIRQTGMRLLRLAGAGTVVAGQEGNRFLLLVRGHISISMPLAIRIIAALSELISVEGHMYRAQSAIGISLYPDHGPGPEMLRRTSTALRMAQEQGSDQIVVYDPAVAAQLREEALLVLDLSQAIRKGELTLHFQPKIDALSMQVVSAEALLRWWHPKRGNVSPAVFIPLAEKHRLMESIGAWVFEEACVNAAAWLKNGLRMRVAVNLSAFQMRQPDLVPNILSTLEQHGLEADRFTCEITETAAMEDSEATKSNFEQMRQAGLHISIDDFGTGYSSLAALRRLQVAELKIDISFVRDLEVSSEARFIAKSIIDMAKALGLRTVAEGVETQGQSELLVDMGCDELQGYFFSMPIPADTLQSMADNRFNTESADFRGSLFANDFDTHSSNAKL